MTRFFGDFFELEALFPLCWVKKKFRLDNFGPSKAPQCLGFSVFGFEGLCFSPGRQENFRRLCLQNEAPPSLISWQVVHGLHGPAEFGFYQ